MNNVWKIILHALIHAILVYLIIRGLRLDLIGAIFAIIGGFIVDVDHVPILLKRGVRGYIYLRTVLERNRPRKYKLHNVATILLSLTLSLLALSPLTFYVGVFFFSMLLHLIFDFFEDFLVYGVVENWV